MRIVTISSFGLVLLISITLFTDTLSITASFLVNNKNDCEGNCEYNDGKIDDYDNDEGRSRRDHDDYDDDGGGHGNRDDDDDRGHYDHDDHDEDDDDQHEDRRHHHGVHDDSKDEGRKASNTDQSRVTGSRNNSAATAVVLVVTVVIGLILIASIASSIFIIAVLYLKHRHRPHTTHGVQSKNNNTAGIKNNNFEDESNYDAASLYTNDNRALSEGSAVTYIVDKDDVNLLT